jgi:REP element-mobilizing transposase RayT
MALFYLGIQLLAARVHDGDHAHLFVSAPSKASIPVMVGFFKCVWVKLLFEEFAELKLWLWGVPL